MTDSKEIDKYIGEIWDEFSRLTDERADEQMLRIAKSIKHQVYIEHTIWRYLSNNYLTVSKYVDGRYKRVSQKQFAKDLAKKLNKPV